MNKRKLRFLELSEFVADQLLLYYEANMYNHSSLAKKLGVSRKKFFDMLRGDYNFSAMEIAKIQEVLGKSFKWK